MENYYLILAKNIKETILQDLEKAAIKENIQAYTLKYIEQTINKAILEVGYDLLQKQIDENKDI